jgi:hypothetical protein
VTTVTWLIRESVTRGPGAGPPGSAAMISLAGWGPAAAGLPVGHWQPASEHESEAVFQVVYYGVMMSRFPPGCPPLSGNLNPYGCQCTGIRARAGPVTP